MSRKQNAMPKSKGNAERYECFWWKESIMFLTKLQEKLSQIQFTKKTKRKKLTLHHTVTISWLELHWNKLILLKFFSTDDKNVKRGLHPHDCPNNITVPEQGRERCYLGDYRWKSKFCELCPETTRTFRDLWQSDENNITPQPSTHTRAQVFQAVNAKYIW